MTYVLDTNIISEITKHPANPQVINWMQDHEADMYLTTITLMELNYGVMRLPDGKKKRRLREAVDMIAREHARRTYQFDGMSACYCAEMRREADAVGRTPQIADVMIAAICKRNDATLVTHNVKDFECFDIDTIDPFTYESPTLKRLKENEANLAE